MSDGDWRIAKVELDGEIKLLRQSQEGSEKRLEKIESNTTKLVWLVLASIVSAVMGFVIQGGLNIG